MVDLIEPARKPSLEDARPLGLKHTFPISDSVSGEYFDVTKRRLHIGINNF